VSSGTDDTDKLEQVKGFIREVPDYPVAGISYKDITPLIENGEIMNTTVDLLASHTAGIEHSKVLCAEARGFVFGTALAYRERKGIVLARKPHKLPRETISARYDLEYSSDSLEIHYDSVSPGEKVLVVDDLLATGGTARAMCKLVESAGGEVAGVAFVIELSYLKGRESLGGYTVLSLLPYDE
jgi:adenine phosphoribosyltransferase